MDEQSTVLHSPTPGQWLTEEQRHGLEETGYLVLPGILSQEQCDVWSRAVDQVWELQRYEPHGYTEEPGVRFADNLLRYSLLFERCLQAPPVLAAVRSVLGGKIKLSLLNGRRTDPGHGLQPLHDLRRRRGRPFLWCSTFWCLDAFTPANGTRVIPGSHLSDAAFRSRFQDPLLPHPDERRIVAPRGAVIVFNSHLIHGGSSNEADTPRRSVQATFTLPDEPSYYDWTELPPAVLRGLSPAGVALLGVGPAGGTRTTPNGQS